MGEVGKQVSSREIPPRNRLRFESSVVKGSEFIALLLRTSDGKFPLKDLFLFPCFPTNIFNQNFPGRLLGGSSHFSEQKQTSS
jgi:hypothetical protein